MNDVLFKRRVIRLCINCDGKCGMNPPVVGCSRIMVPYHLKFGDKEYDSFCMERVWFDRNYEEVDRWVGRELRDALDTLQYYGG